MDKQLTLRPRLSEKTYGLSESRVYVVDIPQHANKHSVARAIETQFEVKVAHVNIANITGKKKRTMSLNGKRYLNSEGQRNNIKKAYITLEKGHGLPFFAAIEEEEAQEVKAQEQFDKAAAKQADKAAKKAPKQTKKVETKAEKVEKTEAKVPAKPAPPKVEPTTPVPTANEGKHRHGFRPGFLFRRKGSK